MKRALMLLGILAIACLGAGVAAAAETPAPTPVLVATSSPAAPAMDPYLGGEFMTWVPSAKECANSEPSQCEFQPNGHPCDTPAGCVCGWSGGQRKCGRFN